MSLGKHSLMTPEERAAEQASRRQSPRPITPEGLQRIPAASLVRGSRTAPAAEGASEKHHPISPKQSQQALWNQQKSPKTKPKRQAKVPGWGDLEKSFRISHCANTDEGETRPKANQTHESQIRANGQRPGVRSRKPRLPGRRRLSRWATCGAYMEATPHATSLGAGAFWTETSKQTPPPPSKMGLAETRSIVESINCSGSVQSPNPR